MKPCTLPALALAAAFLVSTRPAAAAPAVPILSSDDLQPGQPAVVRTVFEGARIDTFSAVIVGVLHSGKLEGDVILARATSPRVVREGVAAGMSGSPVYVDGRLIGALSSGWQFSSEPIFGVTPIADMLRVLDLPEGPPNAPSSGPAGVELGLAARPTRFGEFRWSDEDTVAAPPPAVAGAGGAPTLSRLPLPMVCSGIEPAALTSLAGTLAPLGFTAVMGGRAKGDGPAADSLVPGAAVAVDVMTGDLQLSAIGTVTYRDGDRVLIFGHPFFQAGDVSLPLSTAEIVTILPSLASSFKLGVRGRTAGVATQDRHAAVAGRIGGRARLMPLRVTVAGAKRPRQTFHFDCVEDRLMGPGLIGVAVANSLLECGGASGSQTLRWTLRLYRAGVPPLTLRDVAAGDQPPAELANGVSSPLRFVLNNPFEPVTLDSVTADIEVVPDREQWTLRSARLLDAAVRPGAVVRFAVELDEWRGGHMTRTLSLRVPEEVPDGHYVLFVGGAAEYTHYEALRLPARFRPTSLDDAWRRLQSLRPSDGLYAGLYARAPEITSDGRDYPELPLSALAVLASGTSAGERGRRGEAAVLDELRESVPGVMRGELLLNVTVDRNAP